MRDISLIIDKIRKTVESHKLDGEGKYARWLWQDERNSRKLGLNEYGCADAANILYTIGEFIREPEKRVAWVNTLQELQNKESGLFVEETHHYIHTTAHCVAALELFDALPKYPLNALMKYKEKNVLYDLLEGLGWDINPWNASHQGAGIYAALTITDAVGSEWRKWYFDWFWENEDEVHGFWKKGIENRVREYAYVAAGFHYLFNHESARMPVRFPERMIDACLDMYYHDGLMKTFARQISFMEVDWVYCITRASRKTPYKFYECKEALRTMATTLFDYLEGIDEETDDGFNDLHLLFGTLCAIAELQAALPGEIMTEKPLKLVLDRRPFI